MPGLTSDVRDTWIDIGCVCVSVTRSDLGIPLGSWALLDVDAHVGVGADVGGNSDASVDAEVGIHAEVGVDADDIVDADDALTQMAFGQDKLPFGLERIDVFWVADWGQGAGQATPQSPQVSLQN